MGISTVLERESNLRYAVADPSEARLCRSQKLVGEVDGAPVVTEQNKKSDYIVRVLLNDIPDRKEVAKGLTHLLSVNVNEGVMYPEISQRAAVC